MTKNEQVYLAVRRGETLTSIGKRMGLNYSTIKEMSRLAKEDRVSRAFSAFQQIPGSNHV